MQWSIVYHSTNSDNSIPSQKWDNSEYCILGDIIIHRDNTITIKMGKPSPDELLEKDNATMLYHNITGESIQLQEE